MLPSWSEYKNNHMAIVICILGSGPGPTAVLGYNMIPRHSYLPHVLVHPAPGPVVIPAVRLPPAATTFLVHLSLTHPVVSSPITPTVPAFARPPQVSYPPRGRQICNRRPNHAWYLYTPPVLTFSHPPSSMTF